MLDLYTETELTSVSATTAVGLVALAAMRTLRNVGAPPFAVTVDSVEGYFDVVTMFRITVSKQARCFGLLRFSAICQSSNVGHGRLGNTACRWRSGVPE